MIVFILNMGGIKRYIEFLEELERIVYKQRYFASLSADLYQAVHKRQYFHSLRDELAPIAWHPDRVIDWCFDEDEKRDLKRLWGML